MTPLIPDPPIDESRTMRRLIVVAPTFNNARTLRAILDAVSAQRLDVIVVDDGSTDETNVIVAAWAAQDPAHRHALRHAQNGGKAAAMRTGFERAAMLGFTHVLTIDTDGQHDPTDIAALLAAHLRQRDAIVIGARPMHTPGYPTGSRVGRTLSNALVCIIGGVHVSDSQSGLRIYPLEVVRSLGARTSRYAFETEVLARAGWAAVEVTEVPIRCIYDVPSGRVSHFRPWRDSVSAVLMHLRLLARSLVPWPPPRKLGPVRDDATTGTIIERIVCWLNPLRTWRRIHIDAAERERVAASMGWGLFIGTQPAFGLKTAICLVLAKALRLQPLVVIGASSLTTPPIGFAFWTASIAVGHLLLHGRWTGTARYDVRTLGVSPVLKAVAAEWIVGAIVCGAIAGVIAWLLTRLLMRRFTRPAAGYV